MNIYVGTSGWSYKEWKGSFYPAKLPTDQMLQYYAGRFAAVEVNNSFYRMPSEAALATWAGQVPRHFQFVMKASRRITHNSQLKDADDSLGYFLRAVNPLGPKLGATLFQLPPTFKKDVQRLRDFLLRLPRHWPAAFEFRHDSWFDDEVYQLLRDRDASLVAVDADENDGAGAPLVVTAPWGYLRLRRMNYDQGSLESWAGKITQQPWERAYVFLKHEEGSPAGPGAAEVLQGLLPTRER